MNEFIGGIFLGVLISVFLFFIFRDIIIKRFLLALKEIYRVAINEDNSGVDASMALVSDLMFSYELLLIIRDSISAILISDALNSNKYAEIREVFKSKLSVVEKVIDNAEKMFDMNDFDGYKDLKANYRAMYKEFEKLVANTNKKNISSEMRDIF